MPVTGRAAIWRNLLCLSLSFVLMFTSYQGLVPLQSSFNSIGGLGAVGLAVTYACVLPSSLILAPLALDRLGSKRTMWINLLGYLIYMCLNLLPTWATVIPASALLGICGAPLWAALSQHVVGLAAEFDKATPTAAGQQRRATVPVFFGVFFTIVSSCTIWGNLVSYLALSDRSANSSLTAGNYSCGYRFCGSAGGGGGGAGGVGNGSEGDGGGGPTRPSMDKFYIMMSCFIAVAAVSILVLFFLVDSNDPTPSLDASTSPDTVFTANSGQASVGTVERLRRVAVHLVEPRQLLLAPLTITAGLSQAFSLGDFTEGFVACSSGIPAVGLVMISYGVSQVVTGILAGQAASRIGQAPVLLTGSTALLALLIVSLFWEVAPEPQWLLHAMAAGLGAVDEIWVALLNALYGDYFSDNTNAAFSALRFWQSLGFILGFSYNKPLCMQQKLYVMISLICVSILTFGVGVIVNRRVKRVAPMGNYKDTLVSTVSSNN